MSAGRVEQVTAIHRFTIMEFRTGLFIGDRYRQVTVIAGLTVYIYIYILTIKTRLLFVYVCVYIYIYIYICNELIEETARHRKLIFGMWKSFGYGSSKL